MKCWVKLWIPCLLSKLGVVYGVSQCMKLLPLRLENIFFKDLIGKSDIFQQWIDEKYWCCKCSGTVPVSSGFICSNFGVERYPGVRCSGMWHAVCYTKRNDNNFLLMGWDDINDLLMRVNDLEANDPHKFQVARNGDHIMLLFQCNICHFLNIQKRQAGTRRRNRLGIPS